MASVRASSAKLSGRSLAGLPVIIAVLPFLAVHGDAKVVRLTPAVVAHSEVFLVFPPVHRETVRVRLVMDAVQALFARERAVLEGAEFGGARAPR